MKKKFLDKENVDVNNFFVVVIVIFGLHMLLKSIFGKDYIDMKNMVSDIISGAAAGLVVVIFLAAYEKKFKWAKLDIIFDIKDAFNEALSPIDITYLLQNFFNKKGEKINPNIQIKKNCWR